MTKNEGTIDRAARLVLAVVLGRLRDPDSVVSPDLEARIRSSLASG